MASETPCANCGKSGKTQATQTSLHLIAPTVPDGAKVCPNCGAEMAPLPVLDGDKRVAGTGTTEFRTGSRVGDVILGVSLGIFLPVLLPVFAAVPLFGLFGFLGLSLFVMIPIGVGLPFFIAGRIKRKYQVLGDTMRKTLWGWLIVAGLGILGIIAVYILNP